MSKIFISIIVITSIIDFLLTFMFMNVVIGDASTAGLGRSFAFFVYLPFTIFFATRLIFNLFLLKGKKLGWVGLVITDLLLLVGLFYVFGMRTSNLFVLFPIFLLVVKFVFRKNFGRRLL